MSAASCAKTIIDSMYALIQAIGCMSTSVLVALATNPTAITEDMEKEFVASANATAKVAQKIARALEPPK